MSSVPSEGRRTGKALLAACGAVLGLAITLASCASYQPGYGWPAVYHPADLAPASHMPSAARARQDAPPAVQPEPASGPQSVAVPQRAPRRATEDPGVVALREKLVEGARAVLGRHQLDIRGRRFTMDCTGTVLAIYWYAGIDLAQDFNKLRGDGVSRIYQTLQRRNLLYTTRRPLPGDIIFWDDTYDEPGREGRPNPLSHTGMVVRVDPDGTIAYIHYHIRRGITIDYMNLESPNVQNRMENGTLKVINSPLRLAVPGRPHAARWLAGQLYRVLGMGYLLE